MDADARKAALTSHDLGEAVTDAQAVAPLVASTGADSPRTTPIASPGFMAAIDRDEGAPLMDDVRQYVNGWLTDERGYTIEKFGLDADDEHIAEGVPEGGWWEQQFDNYLHRTNVLGLETPGGRQAFAKFVATAVGALEAVVRTYGELPEPGVPSGNNLDLIRSL